LSRPGGVPDSSIFCQKCGRDIDDISTTDRIYCECRDSAIISTWVSDTSNMIHMLQSLNMMVIGNDCTIQSCVDKSIYYEL
jgi:hypothetical protein